MKNDDKTITSEQNEIKELEQELASFGDSVFARFEGGCTDITTSITEALPDNEGAGIKPDIKKDKPSS